MATTILSGTKPECIRKMLELEQIHGREFWVISMDDSVGTYQLETSDKIAETLNNRAGETQVNEPQLEPNHSWDLDPPSPVYRVIENDEIIAIFFTWDDCLGFLTSPTVKAEKRKLTFTWSNP